MPKESFYTRVERNGATCAMKVSGYVDKERDVGYYVQEHEIFENDWWAIDLKSGQAVAKATRFMGAKQKLHARFGKLEQIRAREDHKKLRDAFAQEIIAAEQAEGGQDT